MTPHRAPPLLIAPAVAALLAASAPLAGELPLGEIVVKGQAFAPEDSAFTATVIDQSTIRDRQVARLEDLFRDIPGLHVRHYGLGGVASVVTLRGFGSGMHGGDIGLAIDGIPLNETMSHADGYADQNVIIPLEVARLTAYKGPVSALYGNFNRGGMLELESRKGGNYRELDLRAGSHATRDAQAALGFQSGALQGNFAAQLHATRGFREQSDTRRGTLAGRLALDLGGGAQLALSGRLHEGRWDSASYVPEAQFADAGQRLRKPAMVMNDGGDKAFATERIDFSQALGDNLRLLAFAYGTQQTFTRYYTRPNPVLWEQRMEDYDRDVRGAGFSLNGLAHPAGRPLNWVAGLETYDESTRYRYRDALDFRAETRASQSRPYLNRTYDSRSVSAFAQGEWDLAPHFRPLLGLRHDRFAGNCAAWSAEFNPGSGNPCGTMADYTHTSPKLGVRSRWSPLLTTRLSLADGFQLPQAAARFGSGGSGVRPTRLRQQEAALTLQPARGYWLDLALFRIDTRDELRDLGGGQFENFGRNRRQGIELDAHAAIHTRFTLSAALTWMQAEVREHASAALIGKAIPGVAERTATVRGRYHGAEGWGGELAIQHISAFPLDAANARHLAGFSTADLTLFREWREAGRRQRYHLTVTNLTDRVYASSGLYSASSGILLLAPGAPRAVLFGLSLDL